MQYNPALDGLRALAVVAVVAFHCKFPIARGGFIGVDVFFVLSGYLITTILRSEVISSGRVDLLRFYWRRALRLWPPLLLMLAGYLAVAPVVFPDADAGLDALIAVLYLSDYAVAVWDVPDFISHTWSLAVEEHFYLIWPLVILATRRWSAGALSVLFGLAFVAATAWRIVEVMRWEDWFYVYYRFDTRISGLMLGGLVAVLPWQPSERAALVLSRISVICLGLGLSAMRWKVFDAITWEGVIIDFAAGALIISLASRVRTPIFSALSWPPLVYLGTISYSVYLWHYPIARALRDQVDPLTMTLVVSVMSVAIAALSYEYMERPLKALRRHKAMTV